MTDIARALTRFELALLALAAAAFLALATSHLEAPGPYGDEVLFVPASLRALGHCEVPGPYVSHRWKQCFPVFLNPPYLGALKAWLYAPVFGAFGVNTTTLRLPAILIALGSLGLLFGWLRRALGTRFAVAATVVAALDPVLVFHARFDWAPFVLANALKLALLGALAAWLREGKARQLALVFGCAVLGLFDKLNFLWLVFAFGGAAVIAYGDRVFRHARAKPNEHAALAAGFALVVGLTIWHRVLPAMQLDIPYLPAKLDLAVQWNRLWGAYALTFSTAFAHNWMFRNPTVIPLWPLWLLGAQALAVAVLALLRIWRSEPERWRLLWFLSAAIALLLAQMLATRQLGSAQHLSMLWPLPTVHLLLAVELLVARFRGTGDSRLLGAPAAWVALLLIAASVPRHAGLLEGWRGELGFYGRFDPAVARMVEEIGGTRADKVVAMDWGLALPLLALSPTERAARVEDFWASFMKPAENDLAAADWLYQHKLSGRDTVFLSFVPAEDVLPETRRNAPSFFARWGGCLRFERSLPSSTGAPLYQVWRYRTDIECAPPDLAAPSADTRGP